MVSPSVKHNKEHSKPFKNSSITSFEPALFKAPSNMNSFKVFKAISSSSQITTPLPAAKPSALITSGYVKSFKDSSPFS